MTGPTQEQQSAPSNTPSTPNTTSNTTPSNTALSAFSDQLAETVARVGNSIVTVAARPRQSATGILWPGQNGIVILTADHVVEREDNITVTLPDNKQAKAALIGRDAGSDIAVLRLTDAEVGESGTPATLGEGPRVGNLVLAIGRPGNDGPRVSFGVVSAIEGPRRSWQGSELEGIIYADLTLFPGFSGGPLVDLAGRVVGMSSSHLTRANGTALPITTLKRVATTLQTHGRVRRGYLGVGTQQVGLPEALAQAANLTQKQGLLIVSVASGSPAEQGGLLLGDILVALGSQAVTDAESLLSQLGTDTVGKPIQVRVLRGGAPHEATVTVGERQ